jgi:hypothetical protein
MENGQEKEMDLLLRAMGRRVAASPSSANAGGGESPSSDHLDADALIAFAENALPVKARSRYLEHLADCNRCRSILIGLSANSEIEPEKIEVKLTGKSSTLIERLMTVFRIPVLQYGLPVAAVLMLVTTVLFTTMRTSNHSLVAVSDRAPELAGTSEHQVSNPEATITSDGRAVGNANKKEQQLQSEASQLEPKPNGIGTAEESKRAASGQVDEKSVASAKDSDSLDRLFDKGKQDGEGIREGSSSSSLPSSMARSAPQGPPPPAAKTAEPEQRRDKAVDDISSADQPAEQAKKAETRNLELAKSGSVAVNGARARRKEPSPAENERGAAIGGASGDLSYAEVERTVGGKRFRKEDGGWVDTSFSSSASAINIRRGSEQYRALLADEPGLRVFAEQLAGSVIVVWKGHAYRFHG